MRLRENKNVQIKFYIFEVGNIFNFFFVKYFVICKSKREENLPFDVFDIYNAYCFCLINVVVDLTKKSEMI